MRRRAVLARHARWLALALLAPAGPAARAAPTAGDTAPGFAGRTHEGQVVSLSDHAGKVVVLSFWASWCGPCRKELPLLEGIQKVAGKDRVQVIAINIEDADTFRKMVPAMSALHMMVTSDTVKEAQRAYGVNGIPHMVIVGKTGQVLRVHRGYTEAGVDDVIRDLNRALVQ